MAQVTDQFKPSVEMSTTLLENEEMEAILTQRRIVLKDFQKQPIWGKLISR